MPTISQEEAQKAIEFTNAITELLTFVDDIAPLIDEGAYLKQMDNLLVCNNNRSIVQQIQYITQRVRNNELVQNEQRRAVMPITKQSKFLTRGEKLASGKWVICEKCDRMVGKGYYAQHRGTDLCKTIKTTKTLTHQFKRTNTEREANLICKIQAWGAKHDKECFYE
jgi:hypothetical protein|tara:strand:- start:197 stop:697 length:501 start_codon:yes stop_codon:yes gene_type:complete